MSQLDTNSPFLPLPDGVMITSVRLVATDLVVHSAKPILTCSGSGCSIVPNCCDSSSGSLAILRT